MMANPNNDGERINYKILYDQAWNQYNIYFQTYSIHNSKFNVIGAVSSIFILVLVTLAQTWSKWLYLSLPFLLFPFFVTLRNLMRGFKIPWFKKDVLESQMLEGEDEFFKHQIDDIFYAATTLLGYKNFTRRWVFRSVSSIVIGVIVSICVFLHLYLLPLVRSLMQGQG